MSHYSDQELSWICLDDKVLVHIFCKEKREAMIGKLLRIKHQQVKGTVYQNRIKNAFIIGQF